MAPSRASNAFCVRTMPRKNVNLPAGTTPAAFNHPQASLYINVSPNTFMEMVRQGLMPAPRCFGARRIWIREELDSALTRLPTAEREVSQ